MARYLGCVLVAFGVVACAPSDTPTWSPDVERTLIRHCAGCHGSSGCTVAWSCFLDDPALLLAPPTSNAYCPSSDTGGDCAISTIEADVMPPGGCATHPGGCVSPAELELLKQWVDGGMTL